MYYVFSSPREGQFASNKVGHEYTVSYSFWRDKLFSTRYIVAYKSYNLTNKSINFLYRFFFLQIYLTDQSHFSFPPVFRLKPRRSVANDAQINNVFISRVNNRPP